MYVYREKWHWKEETFLEFPMLLGCLSGIFLFVIMTLKWIVSQWL